MVCGGVRGIGPVCGESGPGPNLAVPPCEFSSVRTRSLSLSIRFSWCVPALLRRPLSAAGTPRTPPSTGSRRAYMASALLYPINRIRYAKSAFKKMGPHGVGERLHACTTMKPAPATRTPRTTPRSESNHRPAVIGRTKNNARHIRTHSVTHPPDTERRKYAVIINKGKRCSDAHCQRLPYRRRFRLPSFHGLHTAHVSLRHRARAMCTREAENTHTHTKNVIANPEPAPCARGRPKHTKIVQQSKEGRALLSR